MASSNGQCSVCLDPIPNQVVNLVNCQHNCLCNGCVLDYFKKQTKCPLCRETINGKILINNEEFDLSEIYNRSRSNTCSYAFAEQSGRRVSINFDNLGDLDAENQDVSNSDYTSPSVEPVCSFCGDAIDLNSTLHFRCGCSKNKSVACAECLEINSQLSIGHICDFRCTEWTVDDGHDDSDYEPSEDESWRQRRNHNRNHRSRRNVELKEDSDENESVDGEQNLNDDRNGASTINEELKDDTESRDNNQNDGSHINFEEDEDSKENNLLENIDKNSQQNDISENEQENDQNLNKIDDLYQQNFNEKNERKNGVSLCSVLHNTTNTNNVNCVMKEEEENKKVCNVEITPTLSISSAGKSENDASPTPVYQSSQIGNITYRKKNDYFFDAPKMSGSPVKFPPSACKLLLTTTESKKTTFPMVISSVTKRSFRKSVSIEKKVGSQSMDLNKKDESNDSELSLVIDCDSFKNPKKKRRINN